MVDCSSNHRTHESEVSLSSVFDLRGSMPVASPTNSSRRYCTDAAPMPLLLVRSDVLLSRVLTRARSAVLSTFNTRDMTLQLKKTKRRPKSSQFSLKPLAGIHHVKEPAQEHFR